MDDESNEDSAIQAISKSTKQQKAGNVKMVNASSVVLSVKEGKYRMVRRILHNAGHSVLKLHRIKYGEIHLGDLPEGHVRPCSGDEGKWASSLLSRRHLPAAAEQSPLK